MHDGKGARGKGPASGKLRLPPLNALRAFHAVARHKSLRQAADELYVTPQAVGQQIKLLEDSLQVTLFERKGRSIEPTEAAVLLAHYVEAGFAEFAEGVRRITRSGYRDRINLNTSPYFATNYLLHHLSEFREEMPNLDLRLTTMIDMPDFARDDIDMTVQWGYGNWPDVECTLLVRDPKMICCTPEIATRLKTPADLLDCTLLDTVRSKRLWNDIFDHLGMAPGDHHGSISLDDAASMRRATLQGIGVGLLSPHDAEADMRAGVLVAPFGREVLADMPEAQVPGFYLLVPRGHLRVQGVAALHRWMVAQDWAHDLLRDDRPARTGG